VPHAQAPALAACLLLAGTADAAPLLQLKSRQIHPDSPPLLEQARPWQGRVHLLAASEGGQLPSALVPLAALGAQAFVVSTDASALGRSLPTELRWLGAILPRDRTDARLHGALQAGTGQHTLLLRPFRDVPFPAFAAGLAHRSTQSSCDQALRLCSAQAGADQLRQLAAWDPVAWLQPHPGPPEPVLDGVAQALLVDQVRPPSDDDPPQYALSGAGIVAAVWDPDCVDESHPDLAGRVLRDTEGEACSHATQCGGALAGSGAGTQQVYQDWAPYRWTGMAPETELAFFLTGGLTTDFGDQLAEALDEYGAHLASHSYRQGYGGDYDATAAALDGYLWEGQSELSRIIPFFWASANEGDDAGYFSLADYAAAKNLIVVGASNANDDSLAEFSSMGPTTDGRLKPDVLAPGCYDTLAVQVEVDAVRASGVLPQLAWEFETEGDAEGWAPINDLLSFTVSDGLLQSEVTGRDPYMHSPDVSVSTEDIDTVEVLFHAETVTSAQLFWRSSEGDWAEERHLDFFMPGDGALASVALDVAAHENWSGQLTGLRLDPAVMGVTVPEEGPTYVANCGTSLAAPAVAGVAALMLQAWFQANPDQEWGPPPAVYRAALTASALDLVGESSNTNPDLGAPTPYEQGPDYATGYGLVQAPGAVAIFGEHSPEAPRYAYERLEDAQQLRTIELELPADAEELRVVLAWDDPPGEAMAEAALQNDLDLVLIDPAGAIHQPWVLDPEQPTEPASRGRNARDNLEAVSAYEAQAGTWTAQITASSLLEAQSYALVACADGQPLALPPAPADSGDPDSTPPADSGDSTMPDSGSPTAKERTQGCGCAASGPAPWLLAPLLVPLLRRRRGRQIRSSRSLMA